MAGTTIRNTTPDMGMWNKVRLALLVLGAASVGWTATTMPIFRATAPTREIVARIMADQRFRPGALADVLDQMRHEPTRAVVQSAFVRAEALIGFSVADAIRARGSPDAADDEIMVAEGTIRKSLAACPRDSVLWMMLYFSSLLRAGLTPQSLNYLNESYVTGPNEGWISLRRNRLALSIFTSLNELQKELVTAEFARLVDADFLDEAGSNLTSVGFNYRDELLSALISVDIASRQGLSKWLSNNGYKMKIPGVNVEDRPW